MGVGWEGVLLPNDAITAVASCDLDDDEDEDDEVAAV